jgi:hypothetical protein
MTAWIKDGFLYYVSKVVTLEEGVAPRTDDGWEATELQDVIQVIVY